MTIENAEKAIDYTFRNKEILKGALTLSSSSEYNPASEYNNERLEFLGDAILEYIVSEVIFLEGGTEGALTERRKSLVSDSALAPVSEKLGLDKLLVRGKKDNNNKKAIPSVYEAVCAAIYLDGGMEAAKKFVLSTLDFSKKSTGLDYKSKLQILLQSMGQPLPDYSDSVEIGTPQNKKYKLTISAFGESFTVESSKVNGSSGTEQLAAKAALEYYEKKCVNR